MKTETIKLIMTVDVVRPSTIAGDLRNIFTTQGELRKIFDGLGTHIQSEFERAILDAVTDLVCLHVDNVDSITISLAIEDD